MRGIVRKMDQLVIKGKMAMMDKKEAVDQIIIMFIIIAVAAVIAGLLYIYGSGTLLPAVQTKLSDLINSWFTHS